MTYLESQPVQQMANATIPPSLIPAPRIYINAHRVEMTRIGLSHHP